MGISLDPTIRPTDIIMLVGFLVGGLGAFFVVRGDLKMLAKTVELQGEEIKDMKEVVKAQAMQSQRMDYIDRQIEDLRHGVGFKIRTAEYVSAGPTLFDPK